MLLRYHSSVPSGRRSSCAWWGQGKSAAGLLSLRRVYERPGYRRRLLPGLSREVDPAPLRLVGAVQRSEGHPTVGALADALLVGLSTVSRLVETAVEGLLDRRPCHDDRRRARWHLTGDGEELLAEVTERRRELFAELTAGIGLDELAVLKDLLCTLRAKFEGLERGQ